MIAMYVSVFPTFVICIFCYGAVLREIFCKLRSVRYNYCLIFSFKLKFKSIIYDLAFSHK
ncbi:unnamed protein product [Haemonchus placei]|uniref:G_PROTEIN_RECEP_F1_2 domain-containing protein n=1 Tax=Haemonchus placei TaxID=6290 RepID=A0A0N4X6V9_HAEPC|nr:unnamed protein product [Haemonchus placei]